jgi:transposase-like protein
LYLRGLSTGDFKEGLAALLGEDAAGFSPSVVTRLVRAWQDEYGAWKTRSLADRDYVYVWADGVHFNVRLDDERLAALVVIGARPDGTKEVIALEDGYRESTESWLALLRSLKARGMRAPALAVGRRRPGVLGRTARGVSQDARGSVAGCTRSRTFSTSCPKSLQPKAKSALHEMMNAPTKAECERLMAAFDVDYEAKYPKATKALQTEADKLMTHFDFPAEHWRHLRTTNPIESTFATVKLRQRVTKGAGSRIAGPGDGLSAATPRRVELAPPQWSRATAARPGGGLVQGRCSRRT